jgi:hypothetical protein
MKKLIKWIKALHLYLFISKSSYWYRKSTSEWVYEVKTVIPNEYIRTSRYTHKYKYLCLVIWLKYFLSSVDDLYKINSLNKQD